MHPSGLQDLSNTSNALSSSVECTCTHLESIYTRRRRPYSPTLLAATTAILAVTSLHASASPVVGQQQDNEHAHSSWKGKGRAVEDSPYIQYLHGDASSHSSASEMARLGAFALPVEEGRAGGLIKQQQQRQGLYKRSDTSTRRSNTPDGVPSHFEYIDGHWVPSSDWSLNGQNGGSRHGSGSTTGADDSALQVGTDNVNEEEGTGPSTRQNNANATPSTRLGDDTAILDEDEDVLSTTLGWAKSTNAILGVDIDTALSDAHSTASSSSSNAPSLASGAIVTRSNMATYTPLSSPSSTLAASPTSTSRSTSATSSTASSTNNNAGAAYDFSRDVPNGWISDGRTAAYAVPVIIGLSVFLACIIFGLILVLLRMNKSRKRRRKAVLNGQLKLSEEGKVQTRPSSPALSQITSRHSGGGNNDNGEAVTSPTGFSSSINDIRRRGGRTSTEQNDDAENEKINKRRIGRKWSPNLSNNGILRKRRTKIAQLFKRDEEPQEIVIVDDVNTSEDRSIPSGGEDEGNVAAGLRRRSVSSSSSSSRRDANGLRIDDDETLSRTSSNTSTVRPGDGDTMREDGTSGDRAYIRPPPSLRVDTGATFSPSSSSTVAGQASSQIAETTTSTSTNPLSDTSQVPSLQATHARNESIDHGDHHAVPVPSIGPPAYMQPSTPAYSRAPAIIGGTSSTSTTSLNGLVIPPAGYMSNVSTPGLSAGLDEKRLLLGFSNAQQDGSAAPGSSGDAFREQRRYEHLYSSREGSDAQNEQITGAPTLIHNALPASSSSTFMRSNERNEDEEMARRIQHEVLEEQRRELQASLVGHVALSDKEVLGRLRMAASAPSAPPSTNTTAESHGTVGSSSESARHQEASAPSLDEAEEEDVQTNLQVMSTVPASMLPEPPQAFQHALHQLPEVDEKTRLRQIEERQALQLQSTTDYYDNHPSAPSAPPSSSSVMPVNDSATAPSAPVYLDEEDDYVESSHHAAQPSAPPASDLESTPSAPSYVIEDEDEESVTSDPETRPYTEGVI